MYLPKRLPFAFANEIGSYAKKMWIDTVDVDVPVWDEADFPVVASWSERDIWGLDGFIPGRPKVEDRPNLIRHRGGRFYQPFDGVGRRTFLGADTLPDREMHGYGKPGPNISLAKMYETGKSDDGDREKTLVEWFSGKHRRRPLAFDMELRSDSDYELRRREALRLADRIALIGGIVHLEVSQPKLAVVDGRVQLPHLTNVRRYRLVSIITSEARYGDRLPDVVGRTLDAYPSSNTAGLADLEDIAGRIRDEGQHCEIDFKNLFVDPDIDWSYDGELNLRWRCVGELVEKTTPMLPSMTEEEFTAWTRARIVAAKPWVALQSHEIDDVYGDLAVLLRTLDAKDTVREGLERQIGSWDDATVEIAVPRMNIR